MFSLNSLSTLPNLLEVVACPSTIVYSGIPTFLACSMPFHPSSSDLSLFHFHGEPYPRSRTNRY